MRLSSLEKSVLRTLLYSDIFDFPLTTQEVSTRLIGNSAGIKEVESAIKALIKRKHLQTTNSNGQSYYHFSGRQSLVSSRRSRSVISAGKRTKAAFYASLLGRIPSVQAVFLTGSLAVSNTRPDDDIDLLVVASAHSLWRTRPLVVALLEFAGARRRPAATTVQNKVCANIYLSADSLSLPHANRNLYTAYEIIQARPLIDKSGIYTSFITSNSWVREYLPNAFKPAKAKPSKNRVSVPPRFIQLIERFAFKLQYAYMLPKLTNEKVTMSSAFFHPRSLAPVIMGKLRLRQTKYHLNLF